MADVRRILCCDGGGIRGIVTLRCLQVLEARIGPCFQNFDMFAGTSTGGLIAGALAAGLTVSDLIELYAERRSEIFSKNLFGFLHPLLTKYSKKALHRILREHFGEQKLADLSRDILITAVDTVRSETTYFSSFRLPTGGKHGTYRNVRLRDAIEASSSAPTYFTAHGRFIDGGTTVYNNPAYVAAVEALRYSSNKKTSPPESSNYDNVPIEVYSFSTGVQAHAMEPDEAMKKSGLDWLKYVIGESSSQAGYQQNYVAQSELELAEGAIVFYRYDLYLTPENIQWAIPDSTIDPDTLALDAVDDERFDLLSELGKKYGERIFPDTYRLPVPTPGRAAAAAIAIVQRTNRIGEWDRFGAPPPVDDNYVGEVLAQFEMLDKELDG